MHGLYYKKLQYLRDPYVCFVGQPIGGSRDPQIHLVSRIDQQEEEEQATSAIPVRNGYRSGSSSWHESCCLQPAAVYILLCLGHRSAFCGQRPHTAQVFSSSGVLCHSAWHCSSSTAPLYRGLHGSCHVEESQAKKSGLIS